MIERLIQQASKKGAGARRDLWIASPDTWLASVYGQSVSGVVPGGAGASTGFTGQLRQPQPEKASDAAFQGVPVAQFVTSEGLVEIMRCVWMRNNMIHGLVTDSWNKVTLNPLEFIPGYYQRKFTLDATFFLWNSVMWSSDYIWCDTPYANVTATGLRAPYDPVHVG